MKGYDNPNPRDLMEGLEEYATPLDFTQGLGVKTFGQSDWLTINTVDEFFSQVEWLIVKKSVTGFLSAEGEVSFEGIGLCGPSFPGVSDRDDP